MWVKNMHMCFPNFVIEKDIVMYKEAKRLQKGDQIYASITMQGVTVAEIREDNANSIDEVVKKLRKIAKDITGMSKVYIRNMTQGWVVNLSLMLCKSLVKFKSRAELVAEGYCEPNGQLIIQF